MADETKAHVAGVVTRGVAWWSERWAALCGMDNDDWDVESARLDDIWCEDYRAAFVEYALTRPHWTRENAQEWAAEIDKDALGACRGSTAPAAAAKWDVIEAEQEAANG